VLSLYAVLHALQVHAQAVIDYLLRACSLLGHSVDSPVRYVEALGRRGFLGSDEVGVLKRLIRVGNIVVHQYGEIDVERVRRVVESRGYWDVFLIVERLHRRLAEAGVEDP